MLDALIVFLAVAGAAYLNHRRDQPDRWMLQGLLGYHLVFSLIFTYFILSRHGDALSYWTLSTKLWGEPAESWMGHFGLSSFFLHWLNYWPHHYGLSFLTGNILYGLLGYLGIRFLYLLTTKYFLITFKSYWLLLIFFLPNMHFWTAGVGKEALTLFALGGLLYGLDELRTRSWQALAAFVLLFLVRPHIGFLMGAITLGYFLLKPSWAMKWKMTMVAGMGLALALLYPLLINYLVIEDYSWNSLKGLMNFQLDFLQGQAVGSAVEMQKYNQVQRWATFLFRPLLWEANNLENFLAAGENLLYLGITLMGLSQMRFSKWRGIPAFIWMGLAFFGLTTFFFANSLGNMGIMMRMKSFTMVFWLLFCLSQVSALMQTKKAMGPGKKVMT